LAVTLQDIFRYSLKLTLFLENAVQQLSGIHHLKTLKVIL